MADNSNQTDHAQVLPRVYDKDLKALRTSRGDDIKNIDEVSDSLIYVGYAPPGTADISPGWRIARVEIAGTVTKVRWAEGTAEYTNIWSNRASLSYS